MKFIITCLCLLCGFTALGQYKITYNLKYYDISSGEEISPNHESEAVYEAYFIMDGYFKSYYDGGNEFMEFYSSATNELTSIDKNKKFSVIDLSEPLNELKSIKDVDSTAIVLDYTCKIKEFTYEANRTLYFYNSSFKVDPDSFKPFKSWNKILTSTKGALPLKYISYYDNYYMVGTAEEISQSEFSSDDFDPKKAMQVHLENNLAEFKALEKKYKTNYISSEINLEDVKTLYLKGKALSGKIALPLVGYIDHPGFMYMKMDFQNLYFSLGKNEEYEWNYNPIEDKVEKTPIVAEEADTKEEDFFPGMTSLLSDKNAAIHDIRNLEAFDRPLIKVSMYGEEGYKIIYFNTVDHLIYRTETTDKISVYENYKSFQGISFPLKISEIKADKDGFTMVLDEIEFNPEINRSIFYIPDSLIEKTVDMHQEKNSEQHFEEAEEYLADEEYDKAIKAYREAIRQSPQNSLYYNQSGLAKLYSGDYYGAIGDFTNAINISPRFYVAHTNLGFTKKEMGDLESALKDYHNAIAIDSSKASGFSDRGNIYFSLEDYEAAIVDFEKAIARDSTRLVDHFNLAVSLAQLDRYQDALGYYNKAIAAGYTNERVYNYRGVTFYSLEDYESALHDFQASVKLNAENTTYQLNLGKTYSELGESKKALKAFDKIIAMDENNAEAYNLMGIEYFHLEDYDLAVSNFSKAIAIDAKNANYFDNRASSRENLMDFTGAIEDYNQSLILYPDDANIVYRRGLAKANSNNNFDACLDFKKASEMGYEEATVKLKEYCDHRK